jgi:hypothetical protein
LRQANLQGAHLSVAQLQGADLQKAQLQGAILIGTYLQGAKLQRANLQGADLSRAQLQGADLSGAKLQGADLTEAKLQGADLGAAELQGANLELAQLQGANLWGANLQGADLTDSHVWLASLSELEPPVLGVATLNVSPLTAADKADLTEKLKADITDGELLKEVLDTLNPILRKDPEILRKDPEKWDDEGKWKRSIEQGHQPAPDVIAGFLALIACKDPGGHIALGIAEKTNNVSRDYAKPLAKLLLSDTCEGAKALTKENRASLEKLGAE